MKNKLQELVKFTSENNSEEWDNELMLITEAQLLSSAAAAFMNGAGESIALVPALTKEWFDSVFNYAHAVMFFPDGQALVFFMHERRRIVQIAKEFIGNGGKLLVGYTLV